MTERDALLHFAARVDQLRQDIEAWAKLKSTGLFAGHEAMVAHYSLTTASMKLTSTAKRYPEDCI